MDNRTDSFRDARAANFFVDCSPRIVENAALTASTDPYVEAATLNHHNPESMDTKHNQQKKQIKIAWCSGAAANCLVLATVRHEAPTSIDSGHLTRLCRETAGMRVFRRSLKGCCHGFTGVTTKGSVRWFPDRYHNANIRVALRFLKAG